MAESFTSSPEAPLGRGAGERSETERFIPKKHIPSAAALTEEDGALLGHVFAVIAKLAKEQGLDNGYRVISNVGEDAGQTVKHLHFHVLGGEKLPV